MITAAEKFVDIISYLEINTSTQWVPISPLGWIFQLAMVSV